MDFSISTGEIWKHLFSNMDFASRFCEQKVIIEIYTIETNEKKNMECIQNILIIYDDMINSFQL